MNKKINEKKFELVYKATATPFFPICLVAKGYSKKLKELAGVDTTLKLPILAVIYHDTVNWFFKISNKSVGIEILDNILESPRFITKIKTKEKNISAKLLSSIKEDVSHLFTNEMSLNKKGERKLKQLFSDYVEYAYFIDVPGFLFQLYYIDKFKDEIFREMNNASLSEKERAFNLFLSFNKKSNYEKFLFDIIKHVISKRSLKDIELIVQKYYWLVHDYLGDIIDKNYILKLLKKKNKQEIVKELENVKFRIREYNKNKRKFPLFLQNKISNVSDILYLYNERKKQVLNRVNIYIRNIIQYKLPDLSFKKLYKIYQLSPQEIIKLLKEKGEKRKYIENYIQRSKAWVYEIKDNQIKDGDISYINLVKTVEKNKILKGIPASVGKVKGEVSLILNISDIHKFKEGNILVAPFTNVNYLPIMQQAKAILTEIGGLTSHAAIVSRELKKPCIVNIKNLISTLKDGDLIKVDAEKGVVSIIKKNK